MGAVRKKRDLLDSSVFGVFCISLVYNTVVFCGEADLGSNYYPNVLEWEKRSTLVYAKLTLTSLLTYLSSFIASLPQI